MTEKNTSEIVSEKPTHPSKPMVIDGFKVTLPKVSQMALEQAYSKAEHILEYGSGGSTFIALEKGVKKVFTVENDVKWADHINKTLGKRYEADRFVIHKVDVGETKAWGFPRTSSGFSDYHTYSAGVWDRPDFVAPDVVLIDGRFRVACFLTTMIRCNKPTTVLFDDYKRRGQYHWIEEFSKPVKFHGRMAEFSFKPRPFPAEHLTKIVASFVDPT